MKRFFSNGKLLVTAEYLVLDGALSLAIPTKFGQSLEVNNIKDQKIIWKSLDEKGNAWFEDKFLIDEIQISQTSSNDISNRLMQVLNAAQQLNPDFLNITNGLKVKTKLDFSKNWGLGTSSTLINNIAEWAKIDPYTLLENTFGGSGYDIACAQNNQAIIYQLKKGKPIIKPADFNPPFKDQLYFIHLNKKQNSREGIKHYNENKGDLSSTVISDINEITLKMIDCKNLSDFEKLIIQHENIIGKVTKQTPVKDSLFSDFKGGVKSLGAWGGDFVLATSKTNPELYFKDKGFYTIIPYVEMAL